MSEMAAILPVTVQGDRGRYAQKYLDGLLNSLDECWKGDGPLRLLVACPYEDLGFVTKSGLERDHVLVEIIDQDDLCPQMRAFPKMSGYFKQMILKLSVADYFCEDFYLTLDADIYAIRDFGPDTALIGGKAITEWEPRSAHPDWWEGSANLLGCEPFGELNGLSVTPNILSRVLAQKAIARVGAHWNDDPYAVLCRHGQFETGIWTEYTLYSLGAGDEIYNYHHLDYSVHSNSALFWTPEALDDAQAEAKAFESSAGLFAIFQSSLLADPTPYIEAFSRGAQKYRLSQI